MRLAEAVGFGVVWVLVRLRAEGDAEIYSIGKSA